MTSASSSFSNKIINHRNYITRNLWSAYLGGILLFLYQIVGVTTLISRTIDYAFDYKQTVLQLQHAKYNAVTRILGMEQPGWVIVVFIAVAFAFQGFSYVFHQREIDFYLSQPTTRAQRLKSKFLSAISVYLLIYVLSTLISLVVSAALGGVNSFVLINVLMEATRCLVLFLAVYFMSVLAVFLSGTLPIALIVLMIFLALPAAVILELEYYKGIFFSSYYSPDNIVIFASPIFDRFLPMDKVHAMESFDYYNFNMQGLTGAMEYTLFGFIDSLVTALVSFILVCVCSRYRKAEHAGNTICFKGIRVVMKVVLSVVIGTGAGLLFHLLSDYTTSTSKFTIMIVFMLIVTALISCIIEAVLQNNIKKFSAGKCQTIMAVALVALLFVIFKGDLLGYDSYIPDASKVESCAIFGYYSGIQIYGSGFDDMVLSPKDKMEITDVENVLKLAKVGMETIKDVNSYSGGYYYDPGTYMNILYRMKDGRNIYRSICIPYDVDNALIENIIDSKEYKEGAFAVFYDDIVRENPQILENSELIYSTCVSAGRTRIFDYEKLSDAYRKDVLEHYSYELARDTLPIGTVRIEGDYSYSTYYTTGNVQYLMIDLNVYENYENTINYLKETGIYLDNDIDIDNVASIEVTNYYPGHNANKEDMGELINLNLVSKSAVYDEESQINDILDNLLSQGYYSLWYDYNSASDSQYEVTVTLTSPKDIYGNMNSYFTFKMGMVPDFVIADTNE